MIELSKSTLPIFNELIDTLLNPAISLLLSTITTLSESTVPSTILAILFKSAVFAWILDKIFNSIKEKTKDESLKTTIKAEKQKYIKTVSRQIFRKTL